MGKGSGGCNSRPALMLGELNYSQSALQEYKSNRKRGRKKQEIDDIQNRLKKIELEKEGFLKDPNKRKIWLDNLIRYERYKYNLNNNFIIEAYNPNAKIVRTKQEWLKNNYSINMGSNSIPTLLFKPQNDIPIYSVREVFSQNDISNYNTDPLKIKDIKEDILIEIITTDFNYLSMKEQNLLKENTLYAMGDKKLSLSFFKDDNNIVQKAEQIRKLTNLYIRRNM